MRRDLRRLTCAQGPVRLTVISVAELEVLLVMTPYSCPAVTWKDTEAATASELEYFAHPRSF